MKAQPTREQIASRAFENYKAEWPHEPDLPEELSIQYWLGAERELQGDTID